MLSYIVRAVTVFKDGSKLPRYYEFRKLSDAKAFINNYFNGTQLSAYKYDITLLQCKKLKQKNSE